MSHLRAPAPRADRREGGRHGRPVTRTAPPLPDTRIRPQLLRLAVLPPVAVALCGCAAVLFTVRAGGARPGSVVWAVLAGALSVALAAVLIAAVAAGRTAASVSERIGALRRNTARGEADLKALVDGLRRGEGPPTRRARSGPPDDADEFELLAADLARAHETAVATVVRATQLSSRTSSEQKLEVFVNLARRLQSLVHREISILDELENDIEDPDLLKGLFHVDHLATRIRRHSENLAVLGGAVSRRQWSNPVPMTEVLRSAIAEVEQYSRVRLVPPIDGELRGHAVADVIHLLAELIENATVFSAPHTQVLLRAGLVTSGLAVEVEDRGLGMPLDEQQRMNALLADPDQVNVAGLLADGRIGLFVVSQLAKRHGILVRLQTNIYGGVQAVLVVPAGLLGPAPATTAVAPAMPQLPYAAEHPTALRQSVTAPHRPAVGPAAAPGRHSGEPAAVHRRPPVEPAGLPQPVAPPPRPVAQPPAVPRQSTAKPAAVEPGHRTGADRTADRPAPLPVRGSHQQRPNPAEARPGIRADDRQAVAEHAAAPPTPRSAPVRDTADRPRLPRRRAQENLVPELRGGPVVRPDTEPAGHDPGLMAAFRRGISLAETQQAREPGPAGHPAPAAPRGRTTATTATTATTGSVTTGTAATPVSSALLDLTAARAARTEPPVRGDAPARHERPVRHDGNDPAG
jgi:signal transduction histidine kinase